MESKADEKNYNMKNNFETSNAQMRGDNLSEILQLLSQQYQDFVDRKERLENKALGHLTPLSIILAASVAMMIMIAQENSGEDFIYFLSLFFFGGQVYYSIWAFVFALKAYSVKSSYYPDITHYTTENWKMKKSDFLGGLNKGFLETIEDLNRILEKLVDDVQYCRIFLTFALVFGILEVVFFIVYLLYQYIRM
jgi:hypothetical protein